ncbi:MAG TPA: uridine kinase, partial [Bacillota bacterium]|nr:uridine kinase [Bacillota bacterium]
ELPFEERCKLNYDHPKSFETKKLIDDIRNLKKGNAVDIPIYDFTVHTRKKETLRIEPKPVILVDGILILEDRELRSLMDLKVFVDADADERLLRRILRDTKERGRSLESVLTQYMATVKPMHEEFVEPSKKHADIIIPRGGENEPAVNMLIEYISTMLTGR